MKVDPRALFQLRCRSEQFNARVDPARGAEMPRRGQNHPAFDSRVLDLRKIDRRALPRQREVDRLATGLHSTHAQAASFGEQLHFVSRGHPARNQRARDDRAETLHGKSAIDGKPEITGSVFPRHIPGLGKEGAAQGVETRAGFGAHGDDRSVPQK